MTLTPAFVRRSVRTRLVAAFLILAAVMVGLGVFNLTRMSSMHTHVDAASTRDVLPLADLRQLTDDFQAYTVHGLVAGMAGIQNQPKAAELQTNLQVESQKATEADLQQVLTHTPPELLSLAQSIEATWKDYYAKDLKYRQMAAARDPAAGDQTEVAGAAYTQLQKDIVGLTDALVADEAANRAALRESYETARHLTLAMLGVGVALAIGLAFAISRFIRRRINSIRDGVDALANGDLTGVVVGDYEDELGRAGRALSDGVGRVRTMVSGVVAATTEMTSLVGDLGKSMVGVVEASRDGVQHATSVSGTATTLSGNVATLATSSDEMASSIRDISRSAQEAASVAGDAVATVTNTNESLARLADSSAEIGDVIKVITGIAEQTNLLALNATIEAARAGELGKGFAVVATEVKELAQETAKATEDVARRIQAIQADSGHAVDAIGQIGETVARISALQETIAAAVEQQTAAAGEIDRNINVAAAASNEIATDAAAAAESSQTSAAHIEQSREVAQRLTGMATELRERVGQFSV